MTAPRPVLMERQWKARSDCPQCGGRVDLDVGDPLLVCGFCKTRLYFTPTGPLSYRMPTSNSIRPTQDETLIHIPFWRFRGVRYQEWEESEIRGTLLDTTVPAVKGPKNLSSLGIRPQLSPLTLFPSGTSLSPPQLSAEKALRMAQIRARLLEAAPPRIERFIGESTCLIYAPYFLGGNDQDKATLRAAWLPAKEATKLEKDEAESLLKQVQRNRAAFEMGFLPLICRECGADLPPVKSAEALVCAQCRRAWQVCETRFKRIRYVVMRATPPGRTSRMFPFWHLTLGIEGLPLRTRADLRRAVISFQQPPATWEGQAIQLFVPAFKLNPNRFLRVARQVTLTPFDQPEFSASIQRDETPEPVRLPVTEATQAVKMVLAEMLSRRRDFSPLVPKTAIRVRKAHLIYIPFERRSADWIEPLSGQGFSTTALSWGHRL